MIFPRIYSTTNAKRICVSGDAVSEIILENYVLIFINKQSLCEKMCVEDDSI